MAAIVITKNGGRLVWAIPTPRSKARSHMHSREAHLAFGLNYSRLQTDAETHFFYRWLTALTERSRVPWTCDTDPASHETRKH